MSLRRSTSSLRRVPITEGGINYTTPLQRALEEHQWMEAIGRVKHHPSEATRWFKGLLPIHIACLRSAPVSTIDALIEAYPASVLQADETYRGNLPIHYAVESGSSANVVKSLILASPKSLDSKNSNGFVPMDLALNMNVREEDVEGGGGGNDNSQKKNKKEAMMESLKTAMTSTQDKEEGGSEGGSDGGGVMKEESTENKDVEPTKPAEEEKEHIVRSTTIDEEGWMKASLVVVVIGASGDLAKKKTYPSLLNLYDDNLLPPNTVIWGYARSSKTHESLREQLKPFLLKGNHTEKVINDFLSKCFYHKGETYGDMDAFHKLSQHHLAPYEDSVSTLSHNRMFYFAIPPNVFAETGIAIKQTCMAPNGWTRCIIEKPFGKDLQSCEELLSSLSEHFDEEHLYRIDHYLGKEMVQNLIVLRFGNLFFERMWNRDSIQCVLLTFKEPFGTEGRGGYFDQYGIIRDIIQNHLMQVLTLVAMEPPTKVDGPAAGDRIRDAKAQVLEAIPPVTIDECLLGQYEGYTDDPTITNKESNTPTYAAIRVFIHTPRWDGVPFIFKAGKALDERKAEMRIQFKDPPAAKFMFHTKCPRNELVMRLQPNEAIYMKTNVKSPGFSSDPVQAELEVNYDTRFFTRSAYESNPDAYTRLILDVLRGKSGAFVRDDELLRSWEIFTPLLHHIDNHNVRPIPYKKGTRGPKEAEEFISAKSGYLRNFDYQFFAEEERIRKSGLPSGDCDIGLYGLAVMGQNFALNIASHGFKICVGNRSPSKVNLTVNRAKEESGGGLLLPLVGSSDPKNFIQKLKRPRKVILLVMAGKPVDSTIEILSQYMDAGDIIIDGGNEWYLNSIRRAESLKKNKGILFMGMGISGGEEGARNGPSLMPGGPKEAYDLVEPILTSCAAQVKEDDDGPSSSSSCTGYIGPIGSGNYVKMIHNGIEYGDMQLIAESYDIMKTILGMTNEEMSSVFSKWNEGELESYLIEITAKILAKEDDITGEGYVVDYIMDKTGMKGTGRWTIQEAAEQSVAAPTIAAALDGRYMSGRKEERMEASKILQGPSAATAYVDKNQVLVDLEKALYAAKVCSYAQGLGIIQSASDANNWNINLSDCARIWKGGCIIRAKLLSKIQSALQTSSSLPPSNLMVDPGFAKELNDASLSSWRRVIQICFERGVPCPALCASLNYFDSYRRERLPANLTQAQRDFFGGHTYERVDDDEEGKPHHTAWTESHKEIGDISQRTAGEV